MRGFEQERDDRAILRRVGGAVVHQKLELRKNARARVRTTQGKVSSSMA